MSKLDNAIGWFEIYVDDIERATAFYEGVFAQTLTRQAMGPNGPEMAMFPGGPDGTGACGALVQMPQMRKPSTDGVLIYFSCDDCAVEQGRAEQFGGQVWGNKFPIGDRGFIAIIVDTEGNQIGLHSMQQAELGKTSIANSQMVNPQILQTSVSADILKLPSGLPSPYAKPYQDLSILSMDFDIHIC